MDAIIYELLLCKAHNCSKGGANGVANADVYRRMERDIRLPNLQKEAINKKEIPFSSKSMEELEYEAQVKISHVCFNVLAALRKLRSRTYDDAKNQILYKLISRLNHDNTNKELLDQVISEAWDLERKEEIN